MMKNLRTLSLKEEVNKEAEQIEKEVRERDDLDQITVSEEMETSLFNKIQEYEFDKREKVIYRKKKKRHLILGLAAVLILVFGSVMTGVGSKSYWKVLWDRVNSDGNSAIINVEDMDSQESEDTDEIKVYRKITEELGISPVRLGYKPKNMFLIKYSIDTEQRKVLLFYKYGEEVIRYAAYVNDSDSSFGQKELDKMVDEYSITIDEDINCSIKEYEIDKTDRKRYIAEFEYQGVHYQLKGVMEKEKFKKIVRDLKFF